MFQRIEFFVEIEILIASIKSFDGVVLEEFDGFVVADFLACVDERHTG